jgi:FMN reductase
VIRGRASEPAAAGRRRLGGADGVNPSQSAFANARSGAYECFIVRPYRQDRRVTPSSRYSPLIVGLGGTTRATSTSEKTLIKALEAAERAGARTRHLSGVFLAQLPIYDPATANDSPEMQQMLDAVRGADGVIIATPGYHGSISGLMKNALDGLEGLRTDARPYLEGRAVGCIVTADGWQACGTALAAVRTIVHALRGWPTPLGVTFNPSAGALYREDGAFAEARDAQQIDMLAQQVVDFARMKAAVAG